MSNLWTWITIVGMAVITYLLRASFVLAGERLRLPAVVERGLRFVPAAVLSALIVPAILYRDGVIALTATNERLWAGLVAAVVAWWTNNILLTIVVGMVALWGFQWLLGAV